MALILVRHGRTAANAAGLLLGRRLDPDLDEVGRQQAERLARALAPAGRIVASPLRRALATARALGGEVELDPAWAELDYGDLDGTPLADIPPQLWEAWRADPDFRPRGGESLAALGARVRAACERLAPSAAAQDVVVVSHVSPIKAAVAWSLGAADGVAWQMVLAPASITRVGVGERGPFLLAFNVTTHLGDGP